MDDVFSDKPAEQGNGRRVTVKVDVQYSISKFKSNPHAQYHNV